MNDVPDQTLIKNVKTAACSESFVELSRRYENAFYKICHKYTPALINSGVNPQDIYSEKDIVILNCVKTYKASKGAKLSTWICNHARYLCLNSINSRKNLLAVDNDELRKMVDNSCGSQESNPKSGKEDLDFLNNLLSQIKDERISKIITLRHLSDKKREWKYIAKKMNISSQTVINLHERGIKLLRKKFLSKECSDII